MRLNFTPLPAPARQQKETHVLVCGEHPTFCWQSKTLLLPVQMSCIKNKTLTAVKLYDMCMHMCSACITQAPAVPLSQWCFHPRIFLSSLCLLVEPSVQKFETAVNKVLLFVLLFSAGGEQIFLITHTDSLTFFADTKY